MAKNRNRRMTAFAAAAALLMTGLQGPAVVYAQETETPAVLQENAREKEDQILAQQPEEAERSEETAADDESTKEYSTGETAIDGERFPDPVFRDYLEDKIDEDQNGILSEAEIQSVTELDLSDYTDIQSLQGIEKFTELAKLNVSYTSLSSLDVSRNTALTELLCAENPNLTFLTLGSNHNLTVLNCSATGLSSLDISLNENLVYLAMSNTAIQSLDTGSNQALQILYGNNTQVKSLDLRNNTRLRELEWRGNQLLYLELPENGSTQVFLSDSAPVIQVTGDFFDMTEKMPGINTDKVSLVRNGRKNGNLIEEYQAGKAVEYTYDCGQGKTLEVDLQLDIMNDWKESLTITEEIPYGVPLDPSASAAFGNVRFLFSSQKTSGFTAEKPKDAGTYYVKAVVDAEKNYAFLESEPKEFRITQAANEWSRELAMEDWTYGELAADPVAKARYGTVQFVYSGEEQGVYREEVPGEAGIWYVKAQVRETANYAGLESQPVRYEIKKGSAPQIHLPGNLTAVHGDLLGQVALPQGWSWVDDQEMVTAGRQEYRAKLAVDDKNYDYENTVGYDSLEHSVERTLQVQADKAERTLTLTVSGAGLDKVYDGNPVDAGLLQASADNGTGAISYLWEKKNNENWVLMDTIPENAGIYRVTACIEADAYYQAAESAPLEFAIQKNTNRWTKEPAIKGWTYGEKGNDPEGTAVFGQPVYSYSEDQNGIFTSEVPGDAGIWYVKAEVPETENFDGLVMVKEFEIQKAGAPEIQLPENLSAAEGSRLSDVDLPEGWSWMLPGKIIEQDGQNWEARLAVDDRNFDYGKTEGYDPDGHYVKRFLTVRISKWKNTWTEFLSVEGWTYGESPVVPRAASKYGVPEYVYSSMEEGPYTKKIPETAGIWYVKAVVPEGENYSGLESEPVIFEIWRKPVDGNIRIPEIQQASDMDGLELWDGRTRLVRGRDYTVSEKRDGRAVTVTIVFHGNYEGTAVRTYFLDENEIGDGMVQTGEADTMTDPGSREAADSQYGADSLHIAEAVETGDSLNTAMWAVFLGSSGMIACVVLLRKKGRKKGHKKNMI